MKSLKLILILFFLTFAISCGQQKKYIKYTVKKGETMRVIAKRLGMKTRDLLRLNPDVSRRPNPNTVIVIPKGKGTKIVKVIPDVIVDSTKPTDEIDDKKHEIDELKKEFVIHHIKKGDTFYSLTRFYNVSTDELMTLNPVLSDGLKVGQIIKIKKKTEEDVAEISIYEDVIQENTTVKVALMLPFRASKYDSISSKKIFRNNKLANIVTDFYLGAEIAIDSLKKQGLNVVLNLYDTGKKNSSIRTILRNNDLNENDVVIGPLYSSEAKIVVNKLKIPVVFPVYSKSQSKFSSSKLVKTAPEKKVYADELVAYISKEYRGENIIVVSDGTASSNLEKNKIIVSLKKHDSIFEVKQISPKKGYIKKDRFLKVLKTDVKNWVILITKNNVVAADVVNSFISLPEDINVKFFTTDKGVAFDAIDNNMLAKIELTYVTDIFTDESSLAIRVFNKKYKEKNNTYPSFYATKGFDIMYDILIRLASGKELKATFKEGASYRLESKFEYSKKLFNATENNGLFIVKYNKDLSLTRLK